MLWLGIMSVFLQVVLTCENKSRPIVQSILDDILTEAVSRAKDPPPPPPPPASTPSSSSTNTKSAKQSFFTEVPKELLETRRSSRKARYTTHSDNTVNTMAMDISRIAEAASKDDVNCEDLFAAGHLEGFIPKSLKALLDKKEAASAAEESEEFLGQQGGGNPRNLLKDHVKKKHAWPESEKQIKALQKEWKPYVGADYIGMIYKTVEYFSQTYHDYLWPASTKASFIKLYRRWRERFRLPNESVVTDVQDYVRIMVLVNEFIYDLEQREVLEEEDAEFVDDDLLHLTLLSGRLPEHDLRVRIISLQFNWALQDNEVRLFSQAKCVPSTLALKTSVGVGFKFR